jgi:hypothetical protein
MRWTRMCHSESAEYRCIVRFVDWCVLLDWLC